MNEEVVVSSSTSKYTSSIESDDQQSADHQKNYPADGDNLMSDEANRDSADGSKHHDNISSRQDEFATTAIPTDHQHVREGIKNAKQTDQDLKSKNQDGMVCSTFVSFSHESLVPDRHDHTDEESENMLTKTRDNDARSIPSTKEKINEEVGKKQSKVNATNIVSDKDHVDKPKNEEVAVSMNDSEYNSSIHLDDEQSASQQKKPHQLEDNVNARQSVNETRHQNKPSDRQDVSVATPIPTDDQHVHEDIEHDNKTDHESKIKRQNGMFFVYLFCKQDNSASPF